MTQSRVKKPVPVVPIGAGVVVFGLLVVALILDRMMEDSLDSAFGASGGYPESVWDPTRTPA